ncbi:trypsin-like serine peptidase [Prauserella flavalba]|uniref:trypsin-like serine peptidase n=1 Tax=Prauserella flavalba TaxID=1477506 RepID=UPI0036E77458
MRRPLVRCLIASLALAGGSVALAGPAVASPAVTVVEQAAATTEAAENRIEAYWTTERMESAIPADVSLAADKARVPAKKVRAAAVPENPQPRLGKVFFTLGGSNYVCSGTATSSSNGDVVTTAGHCLNEGPGAFATNFAFVPAYDHGSRPYGTWTAERLYTTSAWANSGDFNYDVGFAVMNENASGQSLTQVVGSYPIAFNLARGLTYTSYGYPAGPPFDGESLYSCSGTARQDTVGGSQDQGLTCDMTGGSSGGGWLTSGRINSVNSFKYTFDPSTMYGPYFGSTIQSVYNSASAA